MDDPRGAAGPCGDVAAALNKFSETLSRGTDAPVTDDGDECREARLGAGPR